jgi:hypothetical protein
VPSLIFRFLGLCPEEWRDVTLPTAHTAVLPEVSLLNCTPQDTAASLHQIPSDPPSVQYIYLFLIILGFLNDAFKATQNVASTDRMISQ